MSETKNNVIIKTGIKSVMAGLGTYFILTAIGVLIFWFTGLPEAVMTYAGAVCLGVGCLTAGIKMGSGIGRKGIASGLCAGLILSVILWGIANLLSGGDVLNHTSVIKLAVGLLCGTTGGMIGVNK